MLFEKLINTLENKYSAKYCHFHFRFWINILFKFDWFWIFVNLQFDWINECKEMGKLFVKNLNHKRMGQRFSLSFQWKKVWKSFKRAYKIWKINKWNYICLKSFFNQNIFASAQCIDHCFYRNMKNNYSYKQTEIQVQAVVVE